MDLGCRSHRSHSQTRLALTRSPLIPAVQNPADEKAADCADAENRGVGLGHDRIGQAQEEPEDKADEPSGPGELHTADVEPDREAAGKRASSAARVSGNCIGNMSATATAPKMRPLTMAPVNLPMGS